MKESRLWKRIANRGASTILALVLLAGFLGLGFSTHWKLPKSSTLFGSASDSEAEAWCDTHSVPESICIECGKSVRPRTEEQGWCSLHGVHECVLCTPGLAQRSTAIPTPSLTELRSLAARSLAFAPRVENNTRCKLHGRRLQLAGADVERALSLGVAVVRQTGIEDTLTLPGEIVAEPGRSASLSSRLTGTVWRVEKQPGDTVRAGELLALIDAPDVGKAKAEFQLALAQEDAKRVALENLKLAGTGVAVKTLEDAAAEFAAARLRTLTAEQMLANLALPVTAAEVKGLSAAALAERLRFLGLPYDVAHAATSLTTSNNLLPVFASQAGTITQSVGVAGARAEPGKSLFTILDSQGVTLLLAVKLEDAGRLKIGLPVAVRASDTVTGTGHLEWISPAIDETTRTVSARVSLSNADGLLRVNTPVTATIVLRRETAAVVVPSSAVHWEGDCHVVFVRDKDYETSAVKVYHVRKVRPAGDHLDAAGPLTEIAAGLLPGEWVATANSGLFRSELLKNDLGEG